MQRRPDHPRRLSAAVNAAVVGALALVPALNAIELAAASGDPAGSSAEAAADSAACARPGPPGDAASAQVPDLPVVWQLYAGYAAAGAAKGASAQVPEADRGLEEGAAATCPP